MPLRARTSSTSRATRISRSSHRRSYKRDQLALTCRAPLPFTIRGVSRPETLQLTVSGPGASTHEIVGTMAFDRKDYGMNSGIPFIRIADRVEVDLDLKAARVSGPPMKFK